MNFKRHVPSLLLALVFATLAALIFMRTRLVDLKIGTYIACPGCFDWPVVMSDLPMLALCAGLLLTAGLLHLPWLGRTLQFVLGVLLMIYAVDLVVFRLFNSRLFFSDAALFVSDRAAVWNQFSGGLGGWFPATLALGALLSLPVLLALMTPVRSKGKRLFLTALLAVSLTGGTLLNSEPFVNDWAVDNVFVVNLPSSMNQKYSDQRISELLNQAQPAAPVQVDVSPGQLSRPNVILVMLESWSAWHSALFGGYENWTPRLDAAALSGRRFSNFNSIGFSTDKGLVGILAGQQLWSPFLSWLRTPPFHSMWDVPRSLPAVFGQQDYHTAFLTTGPLSIYRKGEWLENLGFDYVEGNEHPFYAKLPRYAFNAASDEALYQRALDWRSEVQQPYLLVLETVTTHQPYIDPDSGQRSLELTMKYADQAFDGFLQLLRSSAFFDNGILMVVSDHRSMTPIPSRELEAFGSAAHSRVPAFIIGAGFEPGSNDSRAMSQSDIVPGFDARLRGETRLDAFQTLMFAEDDNDPNTSDTPKAGCAFHSRGDRRGLVEILCNTGRGQVELRGDDSLFISQQGLDAGTQQSILDTLAFLRIKAQQRHEHQQAGKTGQEKPGRN